MSNQSRDVSTYLERKEQLEEKLNVKFGSLSAFLGSWEENEYFVRVCGEIDAPNLDCDIIIEVAVYDKEKRIVATDSSHIFLDDFGGFDTFDIRLDLPRVKSISRILVFPKRQT